MGSASGALASDWAGAKSLANFDDGVPRHDILWVSWDICALHVAMVLTLDVRTIYLDVLHMYAVAVSRTDILGIYLDILVIYTGMLSYKCISTYGNGVASNKRA